MTRTDGPKGGTNTKILSRHQGSRSKTRRFPKARRGTRPRMQRLQLPQPPTSDASVSGISQPRQRSGYGPKDARNCKSKSHPPASWCGLSVWSWPESQPEDTPLLWQSLIRLVLRTFSHVSVLPIQKGEKSLSLQLRTSFLPFHATFYFLSKASRLIIQNWHV